MLKNLPEQVNGARIAEIWSHVIWCVPGCRNDLPDKYSKPRILSFPTYPSRPEKRSAPQLMLLADISGHDLPTFNRNGGRIDGIGKQ
jgi:hypothetical protein